jgi:hypothetical protein
MKNVRAEVTQTVEKILHAKCNEEVVNLWSDASAKLSIKELVWVHGKVSHKLLEAVS